MLIVNCESRAQNLQILRNIGYALIILCQRQNKLKIDFLVMTTSLSQRFQGEKIDARSDLYALGILSYALLAGREPFIGPNVSRILLDHISNDPPNILDFRPSLPDPWVGFVQRLLAKDPNDRFQTATEVREALDPLPRDEIEGVA